MSGIVGQNLGRGSGLVKATSSALGDDSVDSDNYVDASIDNAHLADNAVGTDEIADNAVTLAKMVGGTDGNIISYDASGNPVAIATGSDGQVLTSTGAGSPPAFESAAGGGGKILQVINASTTTGVNVATNSYTDTSLTADITPSATSSKILVTVCHQNFNSSTPSNILSWRILRDSTVIWHAGGWASGPWSLMGWQGDRPAQHSSISLSVGYTIGYTWVDSPSSTSALTYKTQIVNGNNTTGYAGCQNNAGNGAPAGHITLMEIDGS